MRSLLFVPGDIDRKIAKAMSSGADALILDLEDSVALDRKDEARAMTSDVITSTTGHEKRPRLYVRINALTTDLWTADLEGVMSVGPDGIILPKPRSGEDVHRLSLALDHAEERAGLKQGSTRIVAIATEVPICVLNMASFVGSSGRL